MEEKLKLKFIPVCFQKDVFNLSDHFKEKQKSENLVYREIPTNLNAKDNYTIIKNLELSFNKAKDSESFNKNSCIKNTTKIFKISKNCDAYHIKLSLKYLKIFNREYSFKIVRFYSYSILNNCYFFLFKIIDDKDEAKYLYKGGIIIPEKENKILIYIKNSGTNKSRNFQSKCEGYLNIFQENFKCIIEAVGNFFSRKDFERLSTVETLECERELSINSYNNIYNYGNFLNNESLPLKQKDFKDTKEYKDRTDINYMHIPDSPEIKFKDTRSLEIVKSKCTKNPNRNKFEIPEKSKNANTSYEEHIEDHCEQEQNSPETINLDEEIYSELLQTSSNDKTGMNILQPQEDLNNDIESNQSISNTQEKIFFHNLKKDESDPDYQKARKLTEEDLKLLNLHNQFLELKKELREANCINISENEIIRFIYGWKGQVRNIKDNMIELEAWRKNYKPETISLKDFEMEPFDYSQIISIPCQDIYGRPIILLKSKNLIPKKILTETFVKYLIYLIETAIKMMPENIDKLIIVLDIKDAGLENFSLNHLNKIREISSRFYVERLSNIVIINKGFFFGMMWSFVSKFLDERILKKLIVLDNSNQIWFRKILGENCKKFVLS